MFKYVYLRMLHVRRWALKNALSILYLLILPQNYFTGWVFSASITYAIVKTRVGIL